MRKLLVFDLDKTLLPFNVSFALGKYLYKEKEISLFSVSMVLLFWTLHVAKILSTESLHKRIFSSIFYGKSQIEIEEVMKRMFSSYTNGNGLISLMRASLLDEIVQARANSDLHGSLEIGLLSASPDFLVEPFAKVLSANWWSSSKYAVDSSGLFTRVERVMTGDAKRAYIELRKAEIKRKGASCIVQAYSDSLQDVNMLLAASLPVCVAPSLFLRIFALIKRWRIIEA